MRLGLDEAGVTELVGVTAFATSLNKVAFGLLLEDEAGAGEALLPEPGGAELDARAHELLAEIADVEARRLGRPGAPAIWRHLARNRRYLEATWKQYRLLFDAGEVDARAKLAVAFGASASNGCRYFIRYFHAALVQAGWDAGRILEVLGVVDQYNTFNAVATGMQIESDIWPQR